jgi:hypothetical protein
VAAKAFRVEHRLSRLRGSGIDGQRVSWRPQRGHEPLQPVEIRELDRIVLSDERHPPQELCGLHPSEDAIDLADVSPHSEGVKAVRCHPIPLGLVLAWRVPKERISHRCVGCPVVLSLVDVEACDPVEDHAKGVQPRRTPCLLRKGLRHEGAEPRIPLGDVRLQGGGSGRAIRRAELSPRKAVEIAAGYENRPNSGIEVLEKLVKVGDGGSTVDSHAPRLLPVDNDDLSCVTRRACHAERIASPVFGGIRPDRETDRESAFVEIGFYVRQISVPRETIATEQGSAISPLEDIEPRNRDEP